jgi:hypothetical protein
MIPNIPKRVWAIQNPVTEETVAICEAHTPEQACDMVAVRLGWSMGMFRSASTASGHAIEEEMAGETLYVVNVTGLVDPASPPPLNSQAMIDITGAAEDGGYYIARLE